MYIVISLVFLLYNVHRKKPIRKWFCISSMPVKDTTAGIDSRHICAGFSWLDGIHNSHVCHSLFKHLVNMNQIVQFTIHWDERTELCGIAWSLLSDWKVYEAALDEQLVAFTDLKNLVLRNLDGLCLAYNKTSIRRAAATHKRPSYRLWEEQTSSLW